jgi:transcriptional regulator with XRE-family HTH domain
MRTTAFAPPFPTDLGNWIAAFRHRVTNERGHPYSPEQLGRQIGVSGATVRRWEAGKLRPDATDASNLARICSLTPLQVAFLSRAVSRRGPNVVPDLETFREKATPILSAEYPIYIMDSMMYIRGWNGYLPHFLSRTREAPANDYHLIDFLIEADEHSGVQPALRDRIRRAVIELWFLTSDACGSSEYRLLLDRLAKYPVFKEEWSRLPFLDESECVDIGLPHVASREDIGTCLICPFAAVLPPVYQVRQFMPIDEVSREKLDELRRKGPPEIIFDTRCHWAQTEEDEPFYRVS